MEAHSFVLLILLITTISLLIQGLVATNLKDDEKLTLQNRLDILNKPATKSFVTKYGDIVDCVDIHKQPAFDHRSLKYHSLQVKPSFKLSKSRKLAGLRPEILPKNMRCPRGTVPIIRRTKMENNLVNKFTPILGTTTTNIPNSVGGHDVAGVGTIGINQGLSGKINVWNPKVKADQYSSTCIYVASEHAGDTDVIQAGWLVSPLVYPNSTETRLYGYWTSTGGKSTGCYDTSCPGFVQTSTTVHLGQVLTSVSTRDGQQQFIDLDLQKDNTTNNWWLHYGGDPVGYWPAELFTALQSAATRVGWGGEVFGPPTEVNAEMGSGYLAHDKGYGHVCIMTNLWMYPSHYFPKPEALNLLMTTPDFYNVIHGNNGDQMQDFIYFGGPKKDQ
ncbi:hypothetical protein RND81_06G244000 [Saponaria officinalis]|uniref:Neprosin PEP catalytic domain-containing protein n=1 Tax=Saponaria officinalis TaxID=3572 RepID=A0AAW1KE20_SAPOF